MQEKRPLKYQAAAQQLMQRIEGMQSGERLPNRNVLAAEMKIARSTLEHAIAQLIAQGYLTAQDGSGTYVSKGSVQRGAEQESERWLALAQDATPLQPNSWAILISSILNDIYPRILRSVQDVARSHDVNLIVCNTDNDMEIQEDYLYKLAKAGVSAMVIVPAICGRANPWVFPALQKRGIRFVSCFRPIPGFFTPGVYGNSFQAGYIGTRHLMRCGCKRIAFFSSPIYQGSYERYQGYLSALAEEPEREPLVSFERSFQYEEGVPLAESLLDGHPEIDGIFAFNDRLAKQAYGALSRRGRRPGQDVMVLGCDNVSICDELSPRLTSIAFSLQEIGQVAAEMLWALTNGRQSEHALQVFGCTIVQRESTAERGV